MYARDGYWLATESCWTHCPHRSSTDAWTYLRPPPADCSHSAGSSTSRHAHAAGIRWHRRAWISHPAPTTPTAPIAAPNSPLNIDEANVEQYNQFHGIESRREMTKQEKKNAKQLNNHFCNKQQQMELIQKSNYWTRSMGNKFDVDKLRTGWSTKLHGQTIMNME